VSLKKQFPLLWELAKRDLWERYSGSSLGAVWSIIYPLVTVFIYLIIFANIMGTRLPGSSNVYSYGIYLIAGVIPWTAFSNTVIRASTVYLDKKNIISKIPVDLNCFPLYIVMSESMIFAITFAIFFGFLFATGYPFTPLILIIPVIFVIQQLFAYALGSILGILVVFVRDLKEAINVIFQFWFWLTPIVYVADILPDFAKSFTVINPAYWFIGGYQRIMSFQAMPDSGQLIILLFVTVILLLYKIKFMRMMERDIRDCI
jgi:lipopolysaccharide transport system permease protein